MLLAGLGIITDPTTKGVADTGIAQTYQKPRDSSNPEEYVNWESQNKSQGALKYHAPEYVDELQKEVVEHEEGLRDVEDNTRLVSNYDSDINNSGVKLDVHESVEGVVADENSSTD